MVHTQDSMAPIQREYHKVKVKLMGLITEEIPTKEFPRLMRPQETQYGDLSRSLKDKREEGLNGTLTE